MRQLSKEERMGLAVVAGVTLLVIGTGADALASRGKWQEEFVPYSRDGIGQMPADCVPGTEIRRWRGTDEITGKITTFRAIHTCAEMGPGRELIQIDRVGRVRR